MASSGGAVTAAVSAPVAPMIEPPSAFGHVAPGIYRCNASSLTKGLPPAPKGWKPVPSAVKPHVVQQDSIRTITAAAANVVHPSTSATGASTSANGPSGGSNRTGPSAAAAHASPTESFLASLQLRTILFLAPERKPSSLAAWCTANHVQLVHLGLGALAESDTAAAAYAELHETPLVSQGGNHGVCGTVSSTAIAPTGSGGARSHTFNTNTSITSLRTDIHNQPNGRASHTFWEPYSGTGSSDMMSLERIAKESLELLLDRSNLPCLICDVSGVNETGVVVGCLRRLQRFNFASIRLEYRSYAGSRARSSHERFIEMFDTDLISFPSHDRLPTWFADQLLQDEEHADERTRRPSISTSVSA